MELKKQPDKYTCGITCIQMIILFIKKEEYSIIELSKMCNFFKYFGTNYSKIKKIFDKLNIKHTKKEIKKNEFKEHLLNFLILQLIYLEDKSPHWVIIIGIFDGKFKILDPYYGLKIISEEELGYFLKYKNYMYLPKFIIKKYIGHNTILIPRNQ